MSCSKLAVPESLKKQLDLFRPLCHRHNTPSGCRHDKDCKMRHDSDWTFDTRDLIEVDFPHTARHVTKNGEVYIVARPPLDDVVSAFFREMRTHHRIIVIIIMYFLHKKIKQNMGVGLPSPAKM